MADLVYVVAVELEGAGLWLIKQHPNGRDWIKHRKITHLIDITPEKEKIEEGPSIS